MFNVLNLFKKLSLKFKIRGIYFIVERVQLKYIHIYWGCIWDKNANRVFCCAKIIMESISEACTNANSNTEQIL